MNDLIFVGKVVSAAKLPSVKGIVIESESQWATPLPAGSQLILLKPDSQTLRVEFVSFVLVRTDRTIKNRVTPVAITSESISKAEDVPIGSTLWIASKPAI